MLFNGFIKIIRAKMSAIISKITEYQAKKATDANTFVIKFEDNINRIVIFKSIPYRIFITEQDIAISDDEGRPVEDIALIVSLLSVIRGTV